MKLLTTLADTSIRNLTANPKHVGKLLKAAQAYPRQALNTLRTGDADLRF